MPRNSRRPNTGSSAKYYNGKHFDETGTFLLPGKCQCAYAGNSNYDRNFNYAGNSNYGRNFNYAGNSSYGNRELDAIHDIYGDQIISQSYHGIYPSGYGLDYDQACKHDPLSKRTQHDNDGLEDGSKEKLVCQQKYDYAMNAYKDLRDTYKCDEYERQQQRATEVIYDEKVGGMRADRAPPRKYWFWEKSKMEADVAAASKRIDICRKKEPVYECGGKSFCEKQRRYFDYT